MKFKVYGAVMISALFAQSAYGQSFFEACQKRFLDGMTCQNAACGPRDVLDLPPKAFCEPTPCKEYLYKDGVEATLAWDTCMKKREASGGKFDSLGQPLPDCTPNPDYPAANAAADKWLACQQSVWSTCDGEFIDMFLVDGGFDLSACQKAFKNGTLPVRPN